MIYYIPMKKDDNISNYKIKFSEEVYKYIVSLSDYGKKNEVVNVLIYGNMEDKDIINFTKISSIEPTKYDSEHPKLTLEQYKEINNYDEDNKYEYMINLVVHPYTDQFTDFINGLEMDLLYDNFNLAKESKMKSSIGILSLDQDNNTYLNIHENFKNDYDNKIIDWISTELNNQKLQTITANYVEDDGISKPYDKFIIK